jgi:hypothetical protein
MGILWLDEGFSSFTADRSSQRTQIIRHVAEFLITMASLKSPVAGSPVRLNATAPMWPSFRDNASARHYGGVGD